MKVNISFDLTPEEFRQACGLPDVARFQDEVMQSVLQKMQAGEEGYDAYSLFKPFMQESFSTMEGFQKNMMNVMGGYMAGEKK